LKIEKVTRPGEVNRKIEFAWPYIKLVHWFVAFNNHKTQQNFAFSFSKSLWSSRE